MRIDEAIRQQTNDELSVIYHALRAQRRRLLVLLLYQKTSSTDSRLTSDSRIDARQLAKTITAIENDVSIDHASGHAYHSVYTSLCQTHLPVLDDLEVITYDKDRKTVRASCNLVPVATIAATTSPIAKLFFQDVGAQLVVGDIATNRPDSIAD